MMSLLLHVNACQHGNNATEVMRVPDVNSFTTAILLTFEVEQTVNSLCIWPRDIMQFVHWERGRLIKFICAGNQKGLCRHSVFTAGSYLHAASWSRDVIDKLP